MCTGKAVVEVIQLSAVGSADKGVPSASSGVIFCLSAQGGNSSRDPKMLLFELCSEYLLHHQLGTTYFHFFFPTSLK